MLAWLSWRDGPKAHSQSSQVLSPTCNLRPWRKQMAIRSYIWNGIGHEVKQLPETLKTFNTKSMFGRKRKVIILEGFQTWLNIWFISEESLPIVRWTSLDFPRFTKSSKGHFLTNVPSGTASPYCAVCWSLSTSCYHVPLEERVDVDAKIGLFLFKLHLTTKDVKQKKRLNDSLMTW